MNWYLETVKPEEYKEVLIALSGEIFTTGYYTAKGDQWVGITRKANEHPFYSIDRDTITHWCYIDPPSLLPSATSSLVARGHAEIQWDSLISTSAPIDETDIT